MANKPPKEINASTEYMRTLGLFIHLFAETEAIMQLLLWTYAGVSIPIGRAIFSGVKADAAMSLIDRILDVTSVPRAKRDDLQNVFAQIRIINGFRNLVVHFGAQGPHQEVALVTNRLMALDEKRLREAPISAAILTSMSNDLLKAKTLL